jgi:hypothetical protein
MPTVWYVSPWTETNLEGVHLRTMETGRTRTERRERAAKEVRDLLAQLYRSFVLWGSVYGDANHHEEQDEMRERVARLLGEFSGHYLPRTVWLEEATRKKIEIFLKKSEGLYRELSAEIEQQGYARVRARITKRVSKELGPLRKEAESGLEAEPAGTRPRWRRRLRRIVSG